MPTTFNYATFNPSSSKSSASTRTVNRSKAHGETFHILDCNARCVDKFEKIGRRDSPRGPARPPLQPRRVHRRRFVSVHSRLSTLPRFRVDKFAELFSPRPVPIYRCIFIGISIDRLGRWEHTPVTKRELHVTASRVSRRIYHTPLNGLLSAIIAERIYVFGETVYGL